MLDPNQLWFSQSFGSRVLRTLLVPASWLYGFGWQCYLAIYQLGIKKAARPHRPVVCVGNLITGGSGKSPVTRYVAERLIALGFEVILGCSGYGSPKAEAATLAPDGPLDAKEWGDEPSMLREFLPEVPLVVGRRRVLAAELAHGKNAKAVLLMDDGFQHLPLYKDVTILIDAEQPRNRCCLPAGPYREPRINRKRATLVLGQEFRSRYGALRYVDRYNQEVVKPIEANVLTAIGDPQRFLLDLTSEGVAIDQAVLLPDHDPLQGGTLLASLEGKKALVITAKDWVKLRQRSDLDRVNVVIALQTLVIEPQEAFDRWLIQNVSPFIDAN